MNDSNDSEQCRSAESVERVWRLRKQNHQVDAQLRTDRQGTEIRFFYDGTLAYGRRLPTRELALAQAAERRRELERSGWTLHW